MRLSAAHGTHRNTLAVLCGEDVVEKRGLAGAEEARDDKHGQSLVALLGALLDEERVAQEAAGLVAGGLVKLDGVSVGRKMSCMGTIWRGRRGRTASDL